MRSLALALWAMLLLQPLPAGGLRWLTMFGADADNAVLSDSELADGCAVDHRAAQHAGRLRHLLVALPLRPRHGWRTRPSTVAEGCRS